MQDHSNRFDASKITVPLRPSAELLHNTLGKDANTVKATFSVCLSYMLTSLLQSGEKSETPVKPDIEAFFESAARNFSYGNLFFMAMRLLSYMNYRSRELRGPILELGTGNAVTANLVFAGRTIDVGSNPIQKLVDMARKLTQVHGEIRLVDAQNIPFEDDSVQTVIANNCIYHVPDKRRALQEVYRVLKPGGVFLFDELDEKDMQMVSPVTASLLSAMGLNQTLEQINAFRSKDHGERTGGFADLEDMKAFFRRTGFEIVEHVPYLSDDLFSLLYFTFDMDDIVGIGTSSQTSIQLPNSQPLMDLYKRFLVPKIIEDANRCKEESKGRYHFFVLRKPAH